ncbi:putative uncharacterized protein [Prevotella sp. CAG:1058]|nr:putative uncharacterized protein [Prevotella sp. CAG:1058]
MKLGILTFHCAHNYGAVLQCYALQETLKKMGHDVEIIDYRPKFLINVYKWFIPRRFIHFNVNKIIRELSILRYRKQRYCGFCRFMDKFYNIGSKINDNINKYETIIIGSDQIWNLQLTRKEGKPYWGEIPYYKGNIIVYGASMEDMNLTSQQELFISGALKRFSLISVREKQLSKFLEKYTNKIVPVVVDPTFLLPVEMWSKIAIIPSNTDKYLLVYQVRNNNKTKQISELIAKQLNLKIIMLSAKVDADNSELCVGASPQQFLGLFKNASFVVSASFHGTVFSILFKKQFFSIKIGDGKDDRVESLLSILGLENRLISDINNKIVDINYDEIEYKKQLLISKSLEILNICN